MKKTKIIAALLLVCAFAFSCGKESLHETDLLSGGQTSSVGNGGQDVGGSGDSGDASESGPDDRPSRPEFIDNTDWSGYDENEYLIGFGATDENAAAEGSQPGGNAAVLQSSGDFNAVSKVSVNLSTRALSWESGDEATVYVPSTGKKGTYAYDATKGQFRPKNEDNIVALGNNLAYIYYPSSLFSSYSEGTATVTMPDAVSANSVESLGDKLPMAGIIPAAQGVPYPTVTFRNLGSVLRVQLTGCEQVTSVELSNSSVALAGSGSVTWNGGTSSSVPTLTTSGGSSSMTVTCASPVTLDEDTATEFYFLLPSSGSMSGMTVRVNFTQNDGSYTYTPYITKTRSSALALSRNKIVKLAFRAGFFSGGDGSASHPYEIATADDFQGLGTYCNGTTAQYGYNSTAGRNYFRSTVHYKQMADINLSGKTLGPIGSATYPFCASYDGDNKTLSNASMTNSSTYVGLFGLCSAGTFSDVVVSGATIESTSTNIYSAAAVLLGAMSDGAAVTGCSVISSTVTGLNCGGIAGYVLDGSITASYARGITLTATENYFCGGIAGRAKNITVTSCSLYGAADDGTGTASRISGGGRVGGIVGEAGYDSGTSTISDCYVSNALIEASAENYGSYAGGQVGYAFAGTSLHGRQGDIKICSVGHQKGTVSITAKDYYAGGMVGYNEGTVTGYKVGDSYIPLVTGNTIVISADQYTGGVAGRNTGTMLRCYANNLNVTSKTSYAGGIAAHSSGTMTDCMIRYSTVQAYNSSADTYGTIVGGMCGYLDGMLDNSGWTASTRDIIVKGTSGTGGIVGYMASGALTGSTTYQCNDNNSSVTGTTIVGGIVGRLVSGTVSSCTNATAVTGSAHNVGGIVGQMDAGTVSSCINGAAVSGHAFNVAGVVGLLNDGLVEKCRNAANVTGVNHCVGGIAGRFLGGTVHLCYSAATATITGAYMVGGLGGYVAGNNNGILIINSASRSAVTSTGADGNGTNCSTGGLVGYLYKNTYDAVLANCVNLGDAVIQNTATAANVNIGGIAGYAMNATIRNCYANRATGTLKYMNGTAVPTTSGSAYGGVCGFLNGTAVLKDCYYRCDGAGRTGASTTVVNHTQLTIAQMNSEATITRIDLSMPRTINNAYFRISLAFGASTATTGNVTDNNLIVYTTSTGDSIKMSNWTRPPVDAVPSYPLPQTLYNLGTNYYAN